MHESCIGRHPRETLPPTRKPVNITNVILMCLACIYLHDGKEWHAFGFRYESHQHVQKDSLKFYCHCVLFFYIKKKSDMGLINMCKVLMFHDASLLPMSASKWIDSFCFRYSKYIYWLHELFDGSGLPSIKLFSSFYFDYVMNNNKPSQGRRHSFHPWSRKTNHNARGFTRQRQNPKAHQRETEHRRSSRDRIDEKERPVTKRHGDDTKQDRWQRRWRRTNS